MTNLLQSFSFELPTRIEYGSDASLQLGNSLKVLGAKRVLIVTDKGIYKAGLLQEIVKQLEDDKLYWTICDDVEPNPKDYNVRKGAEKARQDHVDCLVAVGGGSPIDCAKAISVVATHGGAVRTYEDRGKIIEDVLELVHQEAQEIALSSYSVVPVYIAKVMQTTTTRVRDFVLDPRSFIGLCNQWTNVWLDD